MTPQFTLITFSCHEVDLKDAMNDQTLLAHILESTKAHRVAIYLGAYVFDTRKGWQDMYQLCEFLRGSRKSFLRLPFEGELFGYTVPAVAKALIDMGVTPYTDPPVQR